jgi:hypothetical protein
MRTKQREELASLILERNSLEAKRKHNKQVFFNLEKMLSTATGKKRIDEIKEAMEFGEQLISVHTTLILQLSNARIAKRLGIEVHQVTHGREK